MDRKEYLKQKNKERKSTHKRIELSLPNNKAKRFEKVAKKEKISINKLVEQLATAYLDERYIVPHTIKKRFDEHNFLVRNIANNINQIAHSANIFHGAEKQAILENLEKLNQSVYTFIQEQQKP